MKKHNDTITLILIFFIGLAVLLYPTLSNYINQIHATHAVEAYNEATSAMSDEEINQILSAAYDYNARLAESQTNFISGEPKDEVYNSLLNVTGDGMIGYVTIKKIRVKLPIYHGTSSDVLAAGAGHLEGSSLPVGGARTHAIITGHRGLPAATLFSDLDKLDVGDTFTITVLNQTLTYQVDKISIVEPEDASLLYIPDDGDYVTLLTCTPYSVNTERLLVRGKRTDDPAGTMVTADATQIDPSIVAPIVAAPILILLLVFLFTYDPAKREKKKEKR